MKTIRNEQITKNSNVSTVKNDYYAFVRYT